MAVFKAGMRLFGKQFSGWDETIWVAVLKARMRLFGWQISGWDEIIWVAVLRLVCNYLGGSFKAGMGLFGC